MATEKARWFYKLHCSLRVVAVATQAFGRAATGERGDDLRVSRFSALLPGLSDGRRARSALGDDYSTMGRLSPEDFSFLFSL